MMRFAGIDIGMNHYVAVVDLGGAVLSKPTKFTEDAEGYEKLRQILGENTGLVVAMEASGHYWQNLFAMLSSSGYAVALLNPIRTRRFAESDLERTKTDAIDAVSIARFAAQKNPRITTVPSEVSESLRELVRLRERLVNDKTDRVRQLHRVVDLGFPELKAILEDLSSETATTILRACPTAKAFENATVRYLTQLKGATSGRKIPLQKDTADEILRAARNSVGAHHGEAYRVQVQYACEDIDTLRGRIQKLDEDIRDSLDRHDVGKLLTTITGIGEATAATIVGEAGDITKFSSAKAFVAFVGVCPALKHSGKRTPLSAPIGRLGNKRLRKALYWPTITAVREDPWLKPYYDSLVARGKPKRVALIAAMRKLLCAIYSVAKSGRPFVPRIAEVT